MAILNSLIVSGASRFLNTAYFQDVSISGSATLSSLSLSGNLSVTGTSTLSGNTTVGGTLGVTGAATFNNWITTANNYGWKSAQGGGWYMTDGNYVRSYGKPVMMGHTLYFGNTNRYINTSGDAVLNSISNATNITTNNLSVSNNLHAAHFDLQTVAQLGGSFYVSPTVKFPNSGTTLKVEKSGSTLTLTITDSSITSTTMAGIVWSANSHVKVSGTINGVVTGTMDGTVSSINTSSHVLTLSVSGENSASVVAGTYSASQFSNLTVMIYQRRDGSNDYRVGIWMNCYDVVNSSSTIRIYGGSDTNPNVMLGNLTSAGLGTVNNLTPTGWGLFAQNAFLHGKVVANGGLIGNWTIGESSMYYSSDAPSNSSIVLAPGGKTASVNIGGSGTAQKSWVFTVKNLFGVDTSGALYSSSGKIGGWNIGTSSLYNTTNSMTSTGVGLYLGTDGIRNYASGTQYVNITSGKITALGVDVSGKITATSGAIGGFDITSTAIKTKDVAVTSNADNSISLSSADFTRNINATDREGLRFAIGNKFGVTGDGVIYASSVDLTGKITANTGYIGGTSGWTIASQQLSNGTLGADNSLYLATKNLGSNTSIAGRQGSDWRFTVGSHFGVTNTGALYATSGKIGGWTIGASSLYSGTHSAYDSNVDGIFMDSTYLAGGKQAMWYLKNDGSAKIGALTLSSDGTLAVPAANITGSFSVGKIDGLSDSLSNIENTANVALGQSVWYATCETAAATTAKVATISPTTTNFTLKAGAVVNVSFTNTNSGAVGSITLNVNNTGAKNIKYINNNSITNIPGVGYILANRTYQFVYDGTYWVIQNLNTYTDTINRTKYDIVIRANGTITAGHIICGTSNGYVDIGASVSFDLSYPLLYAATGLSTGGTGSNNYLQINDINAANNGTIVGGAAYKTLYLKGKVSNNTFTIYSSQYLTTTPPTSIDNLYYIPLGTFKSGSTTNIYFNSLSRLYAYINGNFQPVDMAVRRYITDISSGGIKVSYATNPINYLQIVPSGINIFKNDNQIASYGSSIILGELADGKSHVEIDSDSFDVCYGATTGSSAVRVATFGEITRIGNGGSNVLIDGSGFSFTNTDGVEMMKINTDNVVIGKEGSSYFYVDSNSITLKDNDNADVFKVESGGGVSGTETYTHRRGAKFQGNEFNNGCNIERYDNGVRSPADRVWLRFYKKYTYQVIIEGTTYTRTGLRLNASEDLPSTYYQSGYEIDKSVFVFITGGNNGGTKYINDLVDQYCDSTNPTFDIMFSATCKTPSYANLNMDGNMVVTGSIAADKIQSNEIEATGSLTAPGLIFSPTGMSINEVQIANKNVIVTSSNKIDSKPAIGASLTLYSGVYLLVAHGDFNSGSSSGIRTNQIAIYTGTNPVNTNLLNASRVRVTNAAEYWSGLTTHAIVTVPFNTGNTYTVGLTSSIAQSGNSSTTLQAIYLQPTYPDPDD